MRSNLNFILVVVLVLFCLINLLQLGSVTALNALASAVLNCFMISYMIPIAGLLCHKGNPFHKTDIVA